MSTELVHAVMYRDHRMGALCDSGAWGTPALFTAVTENVTCPGCRLKLDGSAAPGKPPGEVRVYPTPEDVETMRTAARACRHRGRATAEAACEQLAEAFESVLGGPDHVRELHLVVIDVEDDAQVDRLARALRQQIHVAGECDSGTCVRDCTRRALRLVAGVS